MSIIVIDGLNNQTTGDTVKNYCQKFGRVLNCYMKSSQCFVTFADKENAEDFLRSSPHRIDSNGLVTANWKTTMLLNFSSEKRPLKTPSNEHCRLTVRGTIDQLEEKNLLRYFSRFGHVRMCNSTPSQGFATITFDDRISYARALNESKHFLNGRSLIVEQYDVESTKRMKTIQTNEPTQYEQCVQMHEYEKQQWNEHFIRQQAQYQQQVAQCQQIIQQSLNELLLKDKQIEQLKQENKDLDDLLRQSVHDNEQQQIQLRKREDVHNQTKRKYEELYRSYMKLKDNLCSNSIDKEPNFLFNKPKSTIENVKKKL